MDSTRALACIAVLVCTLWIAGSVTQLSVSAAPAQPPPQRLALLAAPLSLDQAVSQVQKRYKARVLRSETRQEDGHTCYVLRILSDRGHVRTVRVDAQDGSIR